jgi:hypothetical protein
MHLIGLAQPVAPAWEPEQGWRVLTPDLQQVSAGGQTIIKATFEFTQEFSNYLGTDANQVPVPGRRQRR